MKKDYFDFKSVITGGVPVYHLAGSFDINHLEDMQGVLERTIEHNQARNVIFNLKDLNYIDSSALGVLVNALKMVKKQNGAIYLTHVSKFIQEVLKRVHLEKFFVVLDNELMALAEIRKNQE